MMRVTFFFAITLFMLSPTIHAAESKPQYLEKISRPFCVPGAELNQQTDTCNDNQLFLRQAEACWNKLERLHMSVSKALQARLIADTKKAQKTDFSNNKKDNNVAALAHAYVIQAAEAALADLDEYFDYVVYPDHVNSDAEIFARPCYQNAVVPMDAIAEKMEIKIASMKEGQSEELTNAAISGKSETQLDQLGVAAKAAGKAPTKPGAGPSGFTKSNSGVSGSTQKKP